MVDKDQLDQFGEAVERKKKESERASKESAEGHAHGSVAEGEQADRTSSVRPQDAVDPRTQNSRHKKVTADKWNR